MKDSVHFWSPLVDYYGLNRPLDWQEVFGNQSPMIVEIGSGLGEELTRRASVSQQVNFVGIEQLWDRIYRTLKATDRLRFKESSFQNIRILSLDVIIAFKRLFSSQSIDQIYCLFPCPWLKARHEKHRLFTREDLKLINSRLKLKGEFTIVTDAKVYFDWILEHTDQTGFKVTTQTIDPKFDTKFERKWVKKGQKKFYEIHFIKTKHIAVDIEKDEALKAYKIKEFSPQKFSFKDDPKEPGVFLKETFFDSDKQTMKAQLLVVEDHLKQPFWVTIRKEEEVWKVFRSDGQNFFPTTGIRKALEMVYEAAKKAA